MTELNRPKQRLVKVSELKALEALQTPPPPPLEKEFEKSKYSFLKTDFLLIISPVLILLGLYIAGLNQTQVFADFTLQTSAGIGYPYSYIGTIIMLAAGTLLSVGIAYRWAKSISRGGLIVSQIIGWLAATFAILIVIFGGSYVWESGTYPIIASSFLSINPDVSGVAALIWFAGTSAIVCGLVPMRRWLNKNIV
jgi:hypothetical protein